MDLSNLTWMFTLSLDILKMNASIRFCPPENERLYTFLSTFYDEKIREKQTKRTLFKQCEFSRHASYIFNRHQTVGLEAQYFGDFEFSDDDDEFGGGHSEYSQ